MLFKGLSSNPKLKGKKCVLQPFLREFLSRNFCTQPLSLRHSCCVVYKEREPACSEDEFQELLVPQHVQREAVGGPAAVERRLGVAVQQRVISWINRGLCVC